jgi:uncharacterized protein (DUF342 family)
LRITLNRNLEKQLEDETTNYKQKVAELQKELHVLRETATRYRSEQDLCKYFLLMEIKELTFGSDKGRNEGLRDKLQDLKTENFLLKQKIQREEVLLNNINSEKLKLEFDLELGSERFFSK